MGRKFWIAVSLILALAITAGGVVLSEPGEDTATTQIGKMSIISIYDEKGGKNFKLELPQDSDIVNMLPDNFRFIFIRKSTSEQIKIQVKKEMLQQKGTFPIAYVVAKLDIDEKM